MLSCITEEYEIHWLIRKCIVLEQCLISSLLKLVLVFNLFVSPIRHSEGSEDISEEKTTEFVQCRDLVVLVKVKMCECSVKVGTERSTHTFFDSFKHPLTIFVVDQTITEDTNGLMSPQPDGSRRVLQLILFAVAETTNNLREITKIECVVSFGRCGSQICLNLFIDLECCLDNFLL